MVTLLATENFPCFLEGQSSLRGEHPALPLSRCVPLYGSRDDLSNRGTGKDIKTPPPSSSKQTTWVARAMLIQQPKTVH